MQFANRPLAASLGKHETPQEKKATSRIEAASCSLIGATTRAA